MVLSQLQESNLSQLKALKIRPLCNADTESLCDVLKSAKTIETLELNFKNKDSHYSELLARQISQCADLHRLTLSCNGSSECFQTFSSSLKVPQTSIELNLVDLDAQCFEALSCGPHAKYLDLDVGNCNINKHGMKCLLVCLQNIKEINMRFYGNKFSSDGLAGLAEISDTMHVRALDLSGNNLGSDCAAGLAGLKCMPGLKTLWLSRSNIGLGGAAALGCGLKYLTGQENLSVYYNDIGSDGAAALASKLKYVTGLTSLWLSNNNISDDGAAALASELKYVTGLSYLGLSDNNIGDDGAAALASELKYVTGLTYLGLSDNNIGDDGAIAFSCGLTSHRQLRRLDLSGNSIDVTADKAVIRLLRECESLQDLKLGGIHITTAEDQPYFDVTVSHFITHEDFVAISELLKTT